MSAGLTAVLAGLLSGGFALGGVATNGWLAARREGARFRVETALELAAMERPVWRSSWIELQINLDQQGARLRAAGIPLDLVEAYRKISIICWRDNQESLQYDEDGGIATRYLNARRTTTSAIQSRLLGDGPRRERELAQSVAIQRVHQIVSDPDVAASLTRGLHEDDEA